jgi:hypothetical protein
MIMHMVRLLAYAHGIGPYAVNGWRGVQAARHKGAIQKTYAKTRTAHTTWASPVEKLESDQLLVGTWLLAWLAVALRILLSSHKSDDPPRNRQTKHHRQYCPWSATSGFISAQSLVVGHVANRIQRGKHFASQGSPQSIFVATWKESNTSWLSSGQPAVVIQRSWCHGTRSKSCQFKTQNKYPVITPKPGSIGTDTAPAAKEEGRAAGALPGGNDLMASKFQRGPI